jgi:ABC-type multidrug transport system fused ATPase/permease subunit
MKTTGRYQAKHKYRRIIRYLRPYLALELAVAFILIIVIILGLVDPLVLKVLIDNVLVDRNVTLLNIIVIGMTGLFLLRGVLNILSGYLYHFIGQRILLDIRQSLFTHLERLELGFFHNTKAGEIMSRVNDDVEKLQNIVTSTFISLITDLVTLVAILALIIFLDWRLTLISMTLIPFIFVSQVHLGKKIKAKSRETREKSAEILSFFQEVIVGIKIVQSFVKERFEARRLLRKSKELVHLRVRLGVLGSLTSSVAGFLTSLGPMSILLYGGYEVIHGRLSIGGLIAFYTYVIRLFGPIFRLAQHNVTIQTAMASIERIFEYLDIEPQIRDLPSGRTLSHIDGHVAFREVAFSYDHDKPILNNLSFEVYPGQKVAVVGRSGKGKSTIISLLCRFYDPQAGCILLDNHDIRELRLSFLRKQIGIVSQETMLFNATVLENIRYGDSRADEGRIIEAAKKAHIHDLIISLPLKYETIIGDRGVRLSGGECQRLSIARSILKNSRILILDEAMSSLDAKSERLIQASLEPFMKNRTSIIVAHRLSAIVDVDNIFVLDEGRMVESGRHEELMLRGGIYRMLWDQMIKKGDIQ